jgi:XTP/dITP diphosphohydrolase
MGRPARIVLLHTSPRLPAGLLTARAWRLLADAVVYAGAETPQAAAIRAAGTDVTVLPGPASAQADALLAADADTVVWLAGADGDGPLGQALAERLVAHPEPDERPVLEAEYGSFDPPGARLLDVVAVMDRLRTSCPWDREQTHASLAPYLLEEAYETIDAIDAGERAHLREELGDVLFQVAFHSRVAAESIAADRFDVDDVAGELVEKLVRRHPHVFGDVAVSGADEVVANWDEIKRAEKARDSSVDGVPLAQPALQLAAKLQSRAERAGVEAALPPAADPDGELGSQLFELVRRSRAAGLDAEAALRRAALRYATAVRAAEAASSADADPAATATTPAEAAPSADADPAAGAEPGGTTGAGSADARHAP